ncbi:type II/IV secretion system protein [bacterium]|nr:MAG: type II/IV secretion system protein [bacterium]
MTNPVYFKLGEMLIKEGLISPDQLERAILVQKKEGGRVGEILIKLEIVKESDLAYVLGKQLHIPYTSAKSGSLVPAEDQGLMELIPKDFAIKNIILPLSRNINSLTCAIFDPLDLTLLDNLRKMTNCEIIPVIATKTDILDAAKAFYGRSDLLKNAVEQSYGVKDMTIESDADAKIDTSLSMDRLVAIAEEAPVIKLVELIIRQAIDEKASDIHVEPYRNKIRLRYRVDGKLYDIPPPAKHLHVAIISRIKILAKLDIAEKRLPQDGAFMVRMEDRTIDLRVSVIPTMYGEKVVMRILDRSLVALDFSSLGFEPKQLEQFRKAITSPYGLVLLTGPTGSGKTTTLYAALNEIKNPSINIVTVEDPVEYRMDGINQVQVKPEIGLTFALALRAFLRQDPDVILVGETRDLETAEICIRSALTGHLVLSTLHTNDAPSAVTRLIDIGIEPYLLMPSLLLVVAQRLIRLLCQYCKEAYEPGKEHLAGLNVGTELLYRAKGCSKCNHIGYKGRMPIVEMMVVDSKIRELIGRRVSFQELRKAAVEAGMETLPQSGMRKAEKGLTSIEEVISVTMGMD